MATARQAAICLECKADCWTEEHKSNCRFFKEPCHDCGKYVGQYQKVIKGVIGLAGMGPSPKVLCLDCERG